MVGRIFIRLLSAGVKKFSGGMAGMWCFMQNVSRKTVTFHAECQYKSTHATCRLSAAAEKRTRFWIWSPLQGPFLAIFATEQGESNANIKTLLKRNSLCGFTVPISNI